MDTRALFSTNIALHKFYPLCEINRDDNQLSCWTDFRNDYKIIAGKRASLDQIFPFSSLTIFLSLDDLACKNYMLNIVD